MDASTIVKIGSSSGRRSSASTHCSWPSLIGHSYASIDPSLDANWYAHTRWTRYHPDSANIGSESSNATLIAVANYADANDDATNDDTESGS
jgi:hypothetical protein